MTKSKSRQKVTAQHSPEANLPATGTHKVPESKKSAITKEKLQKSQEELATIEKMVTETHGRELWLAAKTAIAVVSALSMDERSNPLVVIFEGGSGRGKSFVINLLEPDRDATQKRLFRLDSFTPKSFVSHAANRSKDALNEIDLLPKLKDKTLVVKELAPVFRNREDALRENFATLTAVLDGKGLISASGTHGTRGYEGRYVFNWVGGTTPIPPATDRIMSQLGNRMFRYEIAGAHNSEEDLIEFAKNYSPTNTEDQYRKATNSFIAGHFTRFSVNSVRPTEIQFMDTQLEQLVRCATLICIGRVEVTMLKPHWDSEVEYVAGLPEGPHRVIIGLKLMAQALALISGREEVNDEDLEIIRHIAFSSIPQNRRLMLRALLVKDGVLTSADAEKELRISRPTARNWMKEIGATGLAEYRTGHGNEPDSLTLSDQFSWLLGKKDDRKRESAEGKDEAHGEAEPTEVAAESH
jgi:hypothetical protein